MKQSITVVSQEPSQLRSSRWSILLTNFGLTSLIIPPRMILTAEGVCTQCTRIFLFPWVKAVEHAAYSRIASVRHNRGFIWDSIEIETAGGSNYLEIRGLPKSKARHGVARLRERMASESGRVF